MNNPIICVGGVLWETTFHVDEIPGRGIKLLPRSARQLASGMAPSAAAAIARLGGGVELWALLGADANGAACLANLAEDGIGTTQLRTLPQGRTPFSTVLIDPAGERLVVPFFDPELFAQAVPLPLERVAQAAAVLADVRWQAGAEALLRHARAHGVPAVLDADFAPLPVLHALMPLADHVLLSETALEVLCPGQPPAAALPALAATLPAAQVVGVTLGEHGALIWQPTAGLSHHPTLRITPVDTLNAGDIWHGAYVLGLVRGMPLAERVRFANVAAAIKCERPGARLGAPSMAEVMARLG